MSAIITKSISSFGRWAQNKSEKCFKLYKEFLIKGKQERFSDVFQVSPTTINANQNVINQAQTKSWISIPKLQNFRSTLKGDALKLVLQLSYRNNCSANSFFRNNILWRQARKGHLIAFAGLFLFQEENQQSVEKFQREYQIYETVCQNIQDIFPTYQKEDAIFCGDELKLNQFRLGNCERLADNAVTYNAQFLADEDDITSCSSSEYPDESIDSWCQVSSFSDVPVEPVSNGIAVTALLPEKGVQKMSTVLRSREHQLLCGGIDLSCDKDVKRPLPPHPNILKIEQLFCDDLPPTMKRRSDSSVPNKALYFVTNRYEHTLRSCLENRRFESKDIVLIISQLLEAVAHLERNNVVHRNINADNIYLEFDEDGYPRVILGEFGKAYCASSRHDMKVPFRHSCLDTRVEDLSSQAPEVSRAVPGRFGSVSYSKSDAWMAGCVAYHLLRGRNPFKESDDNSTLLDSRTYSVDDLPSLDQVDVPDVVKIVVEMLVASEPSKRLSASEAADILHLELFATPLMQSLCEDVKCQELRNWLNDHCVEAIARQRARSVPYEMCQSFFSRLDSCQLSIACRYWVLIRSAKGLYG